MTDLEPALFFEVPAWLCRAPGGEEGLERKSRDNPLVELLALMGEMQDELRAQFSTFRRLREDADASLGASREETDIKNAKADLKAASDALGGIVRTLEKIDSLKRGLVRDAEDAMDDAGDQRSVDEILAAIESRIEARVADRLASLSGTGLHGDGPQADAAHHDGAAEPPG